MHFLGSKINNTGADENLGNNTEIEDKFDNSIHNVCVSETVISERSIKEEPQDTENEQRSIHNYDVTAVTQETELMMDYIDDKVCIYETLVSDGCIKEEPCDMEEKSESPHVNMKGGNVGDETVVAQETELITDYIDDKVCIDETLVSDWYIKQEPCDMEVKSEHIPVNVKDENIGDQTVVAQETEPITDCKDDKVCIYETLISAGHVKQEPCDTEEESESIYNNVNMKDEKTNAKVNYVTCCKECGETYDLYCLKCPMLIRICNSDNPDRRNSTLPRKFLDLCETPSGVGIIALRAIPKGVVFGPFKELHLTKDDTVSKWKLKNKKLVYTRNSRWLNWMKYIKGADQSAHANLTPFQYEGELYYRSDCHINVGDELLVYWDSDSKESENRDLEGSYWEPQVCESLDDTYACTLCCVGYKSISHLKAHNSVCIEKGNKKDLSEEIVQCDFCKIYLDKNEYSDYHIDRCCKSNKTWAVNKRHAENRGRSSDYQMTAKSIKCESCGFWNNEVHELDDKFYICSKCKTRFKCASNKDLLNVQEDLKRQIATHGDDTPFGCALCSYKAATNLSLKRHMAVDHAKRRFPCTFCSYEAGSMSHLKQHIAAHNNEKPFACAICPYRATLKSNLRRHIAVHNKVMYS